MSADSQLFISGFTLSTDPGDIEAQSKAQYDRVARYFAYSQDHSVKLIVDINTDLYTLQPDTVFEVLLASTLNLDGSKENKEGGTGGWREKQPGETDLSEFWEYVMYGKVYKFEEADDGDKM